MENTTDPKWTCPPTSLDSWPTSDHSHNTEHLGKQYLAGQEHTEHDRWQEAIAADPLNYSHVIRYQNCGTNAWMQENIATGRVRVVHNTCKLRVCPLCSKIASRRIKSRLQLALHGSTLKKWRLITLTAKSEDRPLSESIQALRQAFKKLRQAKSWRQHVDGGYAVLEITWNEETGLWHPHFHVVAAGRYYPWEQLKRDWMQACPGSWNVDIRPVKTTAGAIHYLTSYLGKLGAAAKHAPIEKLTEFYRTIQGQRFLVPFGTAPAPKQPAQELAFDDWRNVCPLWQYIIALRDGALWAIVLAKKLHRSDPATIPNADWHPPPL